MTRKQLSYRETKRFQQDQDKLDYWIEQYDHCMFSTSWQPNSPDTKFLDYCVKKRTRQRELMRRRYLKE